MQTQNQLYLYTLPADTGSKMYDHASLAACLQGLYNRAFGPQLYFLSEDKNTPQYWLDILSKEDEWLSRREKITLPTLSSLIELTKNVVKTAIIWDTAVPASYNVAFTIAGVEDGIVLSPEYAEEILPLFKPERVIDLCGMFNGSVSGSAKNDAYIWAVENYLARGMCSHHWMCLYNDPFMLRDDGNVDYVVNRDWSVFNKAFVYDLSPWGDEIPKDDPDQRLGSDLETYKLILETQRAVNGRQNMTEISGFFNFDKYSHTENNDSRHEPVYTEWESVYIMSEFNCYQNTVTSNCFNQSLHSQFQIRKLQQPRPKEPLPLENACYIGVLMADYDSTMPLYELLPPLWDDPKRGSAPFAWGINPNLTETYPDIITYLYKTAAPDMDVITADASAAGYFNPSRICPEDWDMVEAHNRHFYDLADITITPMVLDWEPLSEKVLDRITGFSPDGVAHIITDLHVLAPDEVGYVKSEIVHNNVIVEEMYNQIFNPTDREKSAELLVKDLLMDDTSDKPAFHFLRIVWQSPTAILDILDKVRCLRPDLDIRLINTYQYFRLHRDYLLSTSI